MVTPAPVLIVDGNPHMTAMLQRFLTRQHVDVQAVCSPAAAHTVLAQRPFRVVLTEAFATSGDGLALVRHIRQTVPGTRVILMTAFDSAEVKREAEHLRVDRYVLKPFDLPQMVSTIEKLLSVDDGMTDAQTEGR